MGLSLIVAMDKNRGIGKDNKLPWKLPADMKFFREKTMNRFIVMGRKTYNSVGNLPNRVSIVLSRDFKYTTNKDGEYIAATINYVVDSQKSLDPIVIGGAEIYKLFLPLVDTMYITEVQGEFEVDTYFPAFDLSEWEEIETVVHDADEKNPYRMIFRTYQRAY